MIVVCPDLRIDLISDFKQLEALASDWARLWSFGPSREVFGTLEWTRACWRAYGEGRRLSTLIIRRGDTVVGIWPLALNCGLLQPVGTPHSDYNDLLCHPADAREVLAAALTVLRAKSFSWRKGAVENIPEGGNLWLAASGLIGEGRSGLYLARGSTCSKILFEGQADYIAERVLGNKHLKRKEKRLSSLGKIEFSHLEDRAEIRELLPDFFQQHLGRRALLGERSMFYEERERFFYQCLVDEFDPRSVLRFGVLRLDGKPIGYHLGFEIDHKLTSYKPTFEASLAKWSPGEVVFKKVFAYVAERSLRECDLTIGLEEFKNRFANVMGRNWNLFLFPSGLRGVLGLRIIRARDWIRKHPEAYAALRPLRPIVGKRK